MLELTLDLPSPFKYGSKVPTNEEVSRVSVSILDDPTIFIGQDLSYEDEVRKLLSDLVPRAPPELVSDLVFMECTHSEDSVVAEILSNDNTRPNKLVLTREERRMISRTRAGLSGQLASDPLQRLTGLARSGDTSPVFGGGESPFEELEFDSQTPQCATAQPEYVEPKGEEWFVPVPAKKRRLGDFPPVVDPRLKPFLQPPDWPRQTIPPHTTVAVPPRQSELLNNRNLPQPSPAPQNLYIPLNATSQPCDLVQPNLSDTVHQSIRSTTGKRRDFDGFLTLRGVRLDESPAAMATEAVADIPETVEALPVPQPAVTEVHPDLIDINTLQTTAADPFPVSRHQYLASLDLLQKHALCRCLSDESAAIDLIEREFLGGVDLILDQDTAILFLPLSTLPSECEGLIAGISDISWRYSHILVIFEAFLVSQAFSDCEENRLASFVFTEPILKSVKKLRRSLMIADGVGTKTEDCFLSWAFAKNIEEAARLVRIYGDMAESRDTTGGLLWQERWWLGTRESEGSPLFEFEVRPASFPQKFLCLIEYPGRR